MSNPQTIPASRLLPADVLAVGTAGLRTRRLRAALSALGVAIGIASMVAVLGLSASSKAGLLHQLDQLGTNLLTVTPGQSFLGQDAVLPEQSRARLTLLAGIERAAAVTTLSDTVRRSSYIPADETNGITLQAATLNLLSTLGGRVGQGRWLDRASSRYPAVVLGAVTAQRLGIGRPGVRVFVDGRWLTVIGILQPLPLAPEIDAAALIGVSAARSVFGAPKTASQLYVRSRQDQVAATRELLASTSNPEHPEEVRVSRPSDALAARAAAKGALTGLFLGLGAVALLVGGIGIANTMVISVLERRGEIGLRRALGATRRHVRLQFLSEALILASLGGLAGLLTGAAVTAAYAASRGWTISLPPAAAAAGLGASVAVGAIAGLYPAERAARMAPTEALRS